VKLNLARNIALPDEIYEALIRMHDGLSDDESARANARLVLLLANHIGDQEAIVEACRIARAAGAAAANG
jgi:hypothetical protein